ncbi:MAG: hypothetical protein AAF928_04375 [Myxococcota bacterium]
MHVETQGGLTVRWFEVPGAGPDAATPPTVVLMHGFGAPGTDLVPLGRALPAPPGTRFLFPEAPMPLPPEFGGGGGRAWWMIDVVRLQLGLMSGQARALKDEDPSGLLEARERLVSMLDAFEAAHGLDRRRLVLGGFSQGAMLATDVALETDVTLAALVLMSGTYLAASRWGLRFEARAGLTVVQSHGRQDPILPYELAEELRDDMVAAGLSVDFHPFDGGHQIPPPVLAAIGGQLAAAAK